MEVLVGLETREVNFRRSLGRSWAIWKCWQCLFRSLFASIIVLMGRFMSFITCQGATGSMLVLDQIDLSETVLLSQLADGAFVFRVLVEADATFRCHPGRRMIRFESRNWLIEYVEFWSSVREGDVHSRLPSKKRSSEEFGCCSRCQTFPPRTLIRRDET